MEYGAFSHIGRVRKCNEDYYYISGSSYPGLELIMVADGMGGHNAGDVASRMAVEEVLSYFSKHYKQMHTIDALKHGILLSIQKANKKIHTLSMTKDRLSGMGTTLTLAIFFGGYVHVGHVGDSRGYLVHDKVTDQITEDHSLVQELYNNGSITKDEMNHHPQKNVITRALGTEETILVDYHQLPFMVGDMLLLCTDGLLHYVSPEEYFKAGIPEGTAGMIAQSLGEKALNMGGIDNITVVVAKNNGLQEAR